jgi:hypothetical protein
MFGIEKFDERTQAVAVLGGFVVALSLIVLLFFLFTTALVKEEEAPQVVSAPGLDLQYVSGVIEVTFREGINHTTATDLMANLGLRASEPFTNPFGRLVYEVEVVRGKEEQLIERLEKENIVYDADFKKVQ